MAGLLPPVSGRIAFQQAGAALAPRDAHEALHYIAHANAVKPRLTLLENVVFWQRFYGGRGDEAQAEAALEAFALLPFAPFPAAHLSQGQTRRLGLCRLLAASRPVWLLDEPTAALDATSARLLERQIDRHLVNGGLAVIATHLDLTLAQQASLDLATAPAQEPQRAAVL
jgi:heme exporter protein A